MEEPIKKSPLFSKEAESLRLKQSEVNYDNGYGDGYKQGYKSALRIFMALVDFKYLKERLDKERDT